MLASYDIKLNPKYTEIIKVLDRITTKKSLQLPLDIDTIDQLWQILN